MCLRIRNYIYIYGYIGRRVKVVFGEPNCVSIDGDARTRLLVPVIFLFFFF